RGLRHLLETDRSAGERGQGARLVSGRRRPGLARWAAAALVCPLAGSHRPARAPGICVRQRRRRTRYHAQRGQVLGLREGAALSLLRYLRREPGEARLLPFRERAIRTAASESVGPLPDRRAGPRARHLEGALRGLPPALATVVGWA